MKAINYSELKKLFAPQPKAESIAELLPLTILLNGTPIMMLSKIEDVINLKDMHPRVQHQLRANENKARVGMIPELVERVTVEKTAEA